MAASFSPSVRTGPDASLSSVCPTGHETKALLNNSGPRYKRSRLERQMNCDVLWCVLLLICMSLFSAIGKSPWRAVRERALLDGPQACLPGTPRLSPSDVVLQLIHVCPRLGLGVFVPVRPHGDASVHELGKACFWNGQFLGWKDSLITSTVMIPVEKVTLTF